ncbi:hypothetical protein F7725_027148 [Dissostichus mawsoni]|uniref:Uncharacterized protein n=1 Tax=Dissostichus mawsoni TaxID=36200 RepID=A0A7J5XC57_DISMA|nr:hypothetical protein F7725_027148 [Dissostichus mawsoni]
MPYESSTKAKDRLRQRKKNRFRDVLSESIDLKTRRSWIVCIESTSDLQSAALALINCETSVSLPLARLTLSMPRNTALSPMRPALADLERARGPLTAA